MPAASSVPAGLIVTCLGGTVLVARHLLPWVAPQVTLPPAILGAASALAYLALLAGVWMTFGGRTGSSPATAAADPPLPADPAPPAPPAPQPPAPQPPAVDAVAPRVLETALLWADELEDEPDPWRSFDQLIRELFVEFAGATRVRLFVARDQGLVPISVEGAGPAADEPPVSDPLLTQCAATGREYFAAKHDPLEPEISDAGAWAWVIPVRRRRELLGVVAVGRIDPLAPPDADRRQLMSHIVAWLWDYARTRDELRRCQQIDKASGVLARSDFFQRAARVIEESNAAHEPFVLVAMAIEGLRRLDDQGLWDRRDALIEAIGREIRRRMRSDDLIGRFSDDRFVMLLRRLDRNLGLLIARKVLDAVRSYLARHVDRWRGISVRAVVAGDVPGSGDLESVLITALEGIEHARRQGCELIDASARPQNKEEPA